MILHSAPTFMQSRWPLQVLQRCSRTMASAAATVGSSQSSTPRATLTDELVLPCGATVPNRVVKAAMTEGLADPLDNLPNQRHETLYRTWADGGLGMNITGNVLVTRQYLECPRNVSLCENQPLEPFRRWAAAVKGSGSRKSVAIMQISHSGRQTPSSVSRSIIAPSALAPNMRFGPLDRLLTAVPRAMTLAEIEQVVKQFATAAHMAEQAGFDGVQIHSAHGYLLSSFLSPRSNVRTDGYGGSPQRRRRLLLEAVQAVREAVSPGFIVGIKLNSADFQRGGFTEEESLAVITALAAGSDGFTECDGVDFVELSGGTYESARFMLNASKPSASTQAREGFFVEFAEKARRVLADPSLAGADARAPMALMVTGGFRSAAGMNAALASGACDLIGMARPLCIEPSLPRRVLSDNTAQAAHYELKVGLIDHTMIPMMNNLWHQYQIALLANGKAPRVDGLSHRFGFSLTIKAITVYLWDPQRSWLVRSRAGRSLALAFVGLCVFALLRWRGMV